MSLILLSFVTNGKDERRRRKISKKIVKFNIRNKWAGIIQHKLLSVCSESYVFKFLLNSIHWVGISFICHAMRHTTHTGISFPLSFIGLMLKQQNIDKEIRSLAASFAHHN